MPLPFPPEAFALVDRASALAMAGLALALASRAGRGERTTALAAALAVAGLAVGDALGLHGLGAKAITGLLPLEGAAHRAAVRAFKVLLLAPLFGSAFAVFAIACRGPLRTILVAWLGCLAAAGVVSELGTIVARPAGRALGWGEEIVELAVTAAAFLAVTLPAVDRARAYASAALSRS